VRWVGGKVCATMFALTGRCTKLSVNSDRKDKCLCLRDEKEVLLLEMAATNGL
jgi:hypothetical protein